MFFNKNKKEPPEINYPEDCYLLQIPAPLEFFKNGLHYDTEISDVIKTYSYHDSVSGSLFGLNDLGVDLTIQSILGKVNAKVVLFKTASDRWFCVYYIKSSPQSYAVIPRESVAKIFEKNRDWDNYKKYIGPLKKA